MAGRFSNEASVSQGIVLRLLNALGWPSYDTEAVSPEYSLSDRRVDYALCSQPGKPSAFIEVKEISQSDRAAERQIFEYASHDLVPLIILTDGRDWNFFLPDEQGDYGERMVYKLDIVARDVNECAKQLERYLLRSAVVSGAAIKATRDDYRDMYRDRQMQAALPKAWHQLIAEEDEMLLEIVADRVESLCGFKPGPDMVMTFLKKDRVAPSVTLARQPQPTQTLRTVSPQRTVISHRQIGFSFEGQFYSTCFAIDALEQVFNLFIKRDPMFGERFSSLPKHGRIRRYLAKDKNDLYPNNRQDLVRDCSRELDSGWWMGTNYNNKTIK